MGMWFVGHDRKTLSQTRRFPELLCPKIKDDTVNTSKDLRKTCTANSISRNSALQQGSDNSDTLRKSPINRRPDLRDKSLDAKHLDHQVNSNLPAAATRPPNVQGYAGNSRSMPKRERGWTRNMDADPNECQRKPNYRRTLRSTTWNLFPRTSNTEEDTWNPQLLNKM